MCRPAIPILCALIRKIATLDPGNFVERQVSGAQSRFYKITMILGQYLRIVVEQRGVNFAPPLFTPDEKKISETASDCNLKFPADPATLSDCNTGLGNGLKGEGLVGMARGFMRAGPRLCRNPV